MLYIFYVPWLSIEPDKLNLIIITIKRNKNNNLVA